MTRHRFLQAMLAAGVLLAASAPLAADVNVGDEAPKIKASDWHNLPRGMKSVKASDLSGQIVMLEFWATW